MAYLGLAAQEGELNLVQGDNHQGAKIGNETSFKCANNEVVVTPAYDYVYVFGAS